MATPAEAVPQWLAPIDLADGGGLNINANVAVAPDGSVLAVWTESVNGKYRARARLRRPGGTFGPNLELTPADGREAGQPWAGVDQQGNFTVTWDELEPPAFAINAIRAARLPAGASSFEPTETVSSGNDALSPRIGVGGGGTAAIVFRQDGVLRGAIRPGAAGGFNPATTLSGSGVNFPSQRVAVDDAGNAIAVWSRNLAVGTTDVVEASERPATGGFAGPADVRTLSSTTSGDKSTAPALAMAPDGRVLALWTFQVGSGVTEVRDIERKPNGTWMAASQLASKPGEIARSADVAIAANGSAVASWIATPGSSDVLQAAVRPPDGAFGGYRTFAATSVGLPVVASNRAGDAEVAWNGSMGEGVFGVRRPAGGDFGSVDTVALGTQGTADPAVSLFLQGLGLDNQGNTTALWERVSFSSSTTTTVDTLHAASYDAAAPSLDAVSVPPTGNPGGAIGMAATASDRLSTPAISWNFGDGATGSGPAVSHAYGAAGAYSVTVTATDSAGNSTSTSRSVVIAAATGPPATPRVESPVFVLWGVAKKRIYLLRLKVTRVPAGAKAQLRCKGRRCPYKRKSSKRVRKGAITIFKEIKPTKVVGKRKRSFRAGQRLQLRVTAPGHIGKVVKYRLRKGRIPSGRTFCLPPGATKPQKTC